MEHTQTKCCMGRTYTKHVFFARDAAQKSRGRVSARLRTLAVSCGQRDQLFKLEYLCLFSFPFLFSSLFLFYFILFFWFFKLECLWLQSGAHHKGDRSEAGVR